MGTTMQHPRLLPLHRRVIRAPLSRLPGEHEQDEVDENGQGDAQENAEEQSEKAPSSHRLGAFRAVGHDPGTPSLGTTFVSKRTSSKTASR